MSVRIVRVAEGKNSTLSHLYIGKRFMCYLLEDKIRDVKIAGQTAIPTGTYKLVLNTTGKMNTRYSRSFPKIHKGMVEIEGLPNFDFVYIHIGNYHTETAGCPLVGKFWQRTEEDYVVKQSRDCYLWLYPKLVALIEKGDTEIVIENNIEEQLMVA